MFSTDGFAQMTVLVAIHPWLMSGMENQQQLFLQLKHYQEIPSIYNFRKIFHQEEKLPL